MRGFRGSATRRWSKRTWVFAAVVLGLLLSGGGAYAALGGTFVQPTSNSVNLQKGLVGWWKLDGNARDSSPYRDNGTVTGAVAAADREGRAAGVLSFDGATGTRLTMGTSQPQTDIGTGSMSWTGWFKTSSTGRGILLRKSDTNNAGGIIIDINGSATGQVRAYVGSTPVSVTTTATNYNNNAWHFMTVVVDRQTNLLKLYVDSTTPTTASISSLSATNLLSNDRLMIGGDGTVGATLNGSLDDVRIYNRILTTAELQVLGKTYDGNTHIDSGLKDLVGWWKLDGSARDSSANRINGTIGGAAPTTDRKGATASAYSFNGSSNYIAIPNAAALTATPKNQWTMAAWIYPTSTSGLQQIIRKDNAGGGYFLRLNGTSLESLFSYGAGFSGNAMGTVTANQWQYVVALYDGSSVRHYINGVQVGVQSVPMTLSFNTSSLAIGATSTVNNEFFSGKIDDVRLYSRALSATEIAAQYDSYNAQINLNSTPTNTPGAGNVNQGLVAYYPFNGNAKDSTPYRNNGTLNGTVALTTDRFGRANSAYGFSGTSAYIEVADKPQINATTGSWSVWFKPTTSLAQDTYSSVISKVNGAANSCPGLMLIWGHYDVDSITVFSKSSPSCGQPQADIDSNGVNSWQHVVVTFNGNATTNVYINGTFAGSYTPEVNWSFPSAPLRIGKSTDPYFQNFIGSIDDVRIYNRVLSTTEITALYNSSL